MRNIFNILLLVLIAFLGYLLYANIKEPIAFQAEKKTRKGAVTAQLEKIRKTQEMYRDITGEFANDFDTLAHVLRTDSFKFENIVVDPEDPSNSALFERIVSYSMAIDSVNALGFNLDSLKYVPFTDGGVFTIHADTLTYQKTLVSVVEVGTKWKNFMGEFADAKYQKYDQSYDPNRMIKFGDLSKPNLGGNWER